MDFIFGEKEIPRTAHFQNCTLALIRPHALLSGNLFFSNFFYIKIEMNYLGQAGKIIDTILKANFHISDMELFQLDRANAEEFIEVYKGVVPEYHLMLDQLTSGPLIAL